MKEKCCKDKIDKAICNLDICHFLTMVSLSIKSGGGDSGDRRCVCGGGGGGGGVDMLRYVKERYVFYCTKLNTIW